MLNKAAMAHMFRNDFETTHADATKAVDWFFDTIAKELISGGHVEARNFGTIDTAVRKGGVARNPRTGEGGIPYPAKKRARIRTGKALLDALNPSA